MSMTNGVYTANGAIYVDKHVKSTMYSAICTTCPARNICTEPDKERRITCPDEIYNLLWNQVMCECFADKSDRFTITIHGLDEQSVAQIEKLKKEWEDGVISWYTYWVEAQNIISNATKR